MSKMFKGCASRGRQTSALVIGLIVAAVLVNPAFADNSWTGKTQFDVKTRPEDLKLTDQKLYMPDPQFKEVADETYEVDCEAIVDAPAEDVFRVSLDYDHYKEFAPYVLDNQTVETVDAGGKWPSTDYYVWTKMRYTASYLLFSKTMIAKYYLHAQPLRGVKKPNDFAIRWVLEKRHKENPRWKFDTESYFSILDGSWYILPLDEHRTYVRYFIKVKTDTWFPDRIVKSAMKGSLKPGVKKLILAIAKRAKTLSQAAHPSAPTGVVETWRQTFNERESGPTTTPESVNNRSP